MTIQSTKMFRRQSATFTAIALFASIVSTAALTHVATDGGLAPVMAAVNEVPAGRMVA
ncbi:hypothetical protein [Sphingomonas qomolangmaensis]|uniref:Uncharacterized protein n=1 Tax=Sphingomonas qomolangmaensis TaxID=2918765 RepID=A0ABY5LG10_9SPHN|nr:hypothetical protein [Sphingomonas qomolangmaensis]UUL83641.1 hypothetical protein NMP03_05330 [Sphingomonas qomolangmaensis]